VSRSNPKLLGFPFFCYCWCSRQVDNADNLKVPDFHRLVNYPGYIARGRTTARGNRPIGRPDGKKNCVMCGKLRRSLAAKVAPNSTAPRRLDGEEEEKDDAAHVIPRQNKGVCTACDVAVWVVLDDDWGDDSDQKLEVKWCKGCKNFRPWAGYVQYRIVNVFDCIP